MNVIVKAETDWECIEIKETEKGFSYYVGECVSLYDFPLFHLFIETEEDLKILEEVIRDDAVFYVEDKKLTKPEWIEFLRKKLFEKITSGHLSE